MGLDAEVNRLIRDSGKKKVTDLNIDANQLIRSAKRWECYRFEHQRGSANPKYHRSKCYVKRGLINPK